MKTKLYILTLAILSLSFQTLVAQSTSSNGDNTQYVETFGTGTTKTALPAGRTTYNFNGSSSLTDGDYFIYNHTNGRPEWHNTTDHTGNPNGDMMVINASFAAGEFYRDTISQLNTNLQYSVYMYVMNLDTLGTCGASAILPKLQVIVESYSSSTRSFVPLTTFNSGSLPQTSKPKWVFFGGNFSLPKDVTLVRYRIINNSTGGCGNDLAIDDITFSKATSFTLPVTGLVASAFRSGSEVTVNWQTLTESNTSHFVVQKTTNGKDWDAIATVKAAGNSQWKIEYSVKDENPGTDNQYRIQQVDIDGRFTYSNIVLLRINDVTTKVNIYPNPFAENIQMDMHTDRSQAVTIRVVDMSGRSLKQLSWELKKGDNSIALNDLHNIPSGMYLLDVRSTEGQSIYSGKLIKK